MPRNSQSPTDDELLRMMGQLDIGERDFRTDREKYQDNITFCRVELGITEDHFPTSIKALGELYNELLSQLEPPSLSQLNEMDRLLTTQHMEFEGEIISKKHASLQIAKMKQWRDNPEMQRRLEIVRKQTEEDFQRSLDEALDNELVDINELDYESELQYNRETTIPAEILEINDLQEQTKALDEHYAKEQRREEMLGRAFGIGGSLVVVLVSCILPVIGIVLSLVCIAAVFWITVLNQPSIDSNDFLIVFLVVLGCSIGGCVLGFHLGFDEFWLK